jgi:hypothetical protein
MPASVNRCPHRMFFGLCADCQAIVDQTRDEYRDAVVNPHSLGFCCRYACNETCIGCGDESNGESIAESGDLTVAELFELQNNADLAEKLRWIKAQIEQVPEHNRTALESAILAKLV